MIARFRDESAPQTILFGSGALNQLGEEIARLGMDRPLFVTSGSYVRNGVAAHVEHLLPAGRLFADVRPHVPTETVEAARRAAAGRDGVVALGGGSALGTGKAVAAALRLPLAAIPTTYAGSEMTAVYGITDQGHKRTVWDEAALPRLVLYDPDLTLDLPDEITAGTGANALAHCVESMYTLQRTPLASACAREAAPTILETLPDLMQHGQYVEARTHMLAAAHLAGITIAHAGMALHHAICHALGGAGLPHGVANAVMLPHVMRYNLLAAGSDLLSLARAIDPGADAASQAVERVEARLRSLPLPACLRDTGISDALFPHMAAEVAESASARNNPRPAGPQEIAEILRQAW